MKLSLFLAALLLSGCAVINVPTWNETEYSDIVSIAVLTSKGTCEIEQTEQIHAVSTHLRYYTWNLPHNELIFTGAHNLNLAAETLNHEAHDGPVSRTYCAIKLKAINNMAYALAKASGQKPK